MTLDKIKTDTTWNDAAGSINSNFAKIKQALELGGGGGGSGENPSGEGDKNYYHTQGTPAAEWVIEHNLGKYPSVTVVSSAGEEIYCDKTFLSMNKVVLNFGTEISGAAFLN